MMRIFRGDLFNELLRTRQARIELDLKEARDRFDQTTNIGNGFEFSVRDVLLRHLPAWTSVGHGEAIDSKGGKSAQTDIVITSHDHPFRTQTERADTYIIEGVVAAGEAKSNLTSEGMKNSLEKAARFKQLESVYPFRTEFSAHRADAERYYKHPPCFLVASESQIKLEKAREMAIEFIGGDGWMVNKTLDAAFILQSGFLINTGDGKGIISGRNANGSVSKGWIVSQDRESVLSAMIVWLSMSMLKMQVPNSLLNIYCEHGSSDADQAT